MSKRSKPEVKRIVDGFKSIIVAKWMANGCELPEGTVASDWKLHVESLFVNGEIVDATRVELNRINFKVKKVFCGDGTTAESF